ncbi:hypothetical protein [Pseudothermotoga sp.]
MFSDKPQVGKAGVVYDNNLLDWLRDPKLPVVILESQNLMHIASLLHATKVPFESAKLTKPKLIVESNDGTRTVHELHLPQIEIRPNEPCNTPNGSFVVDQRLKLVQLDLFTIQQINVKKVWLEADWAEVRTAPIDFSVLRNSSMQRGISRITKHLALATQFQRYIYTINGLVYMLNLFADNAKKVKLRFEWIPVEKYQLIGEKVVSSCRHGKTEVQLAGELWRNSSDTLLIGRLDVTHEDERALFAATSVILVQAYTNVDDFYIMPLRFVVHTGKTAEKIFNNEERLTELLENTWKFHNSTVYIGRSYVIGPAYTQTICKAVAELDGRKIIVQQVQPPRVESESVPTAIAVCEKKTFEFRSSDNNIFFVNKSGPRCGRLLDLKLKLGNREIGATDLIKKMFVEHASLSTLLDNQVTILRSMDKLYGVALPAFVLAKLVVEAVHRAMTSQAGFEPIGFALARVDQTVHTNINLVVIGTIDGAMFGHVYKVIYFSSRSQTSNRKLQDHTSRQAWLLLPSFFGPAFERDGCWVIANEKGIHVTWYEPDKHKLLISFNDLITLNDLIYSEDPKIKYKE